MAGTPQGPPPPPPRRSTEPGPPPEKRAQMRDAVQDVMRKVQAEREAAMAEALAQHAKSRRRQARGIVLVALAALLLVSAVLWALPRWRHPFAGRTGPAAERDARTAILFVAQVVDNYRVQHQRLPRSLRETGVVLPGITYADGGDSYHLSTVVEGRRIEFASTQDRGAFAAGR